MSGGVAPVVSGYGGLRLLGEGASALVFRATRAGGADVVLKIARRPADPLLVREAEIAGRAGAHVTPRVLDVGESADGCPYIAFEHVAADTLQALVAALPVPRPPAAWWQAAMALCRTAARLHARGLVHRDIKPANVLVEGTLEAVARVLLIDFGIGRDADDAELATVARTGRQLGTPVYMAPELCRGDRDVGPAADVYALGVVLYELCAGAPPFAGSAPDIERAHVLERPRSLAQVAPMAASLEAIVMRALAKEPSERWADAGALANALAESTPSALGARDTPSAERRPPAVVADGHASERAALLAVRGGLELPRVRAEVEEQGGVVARVSGDTIVAVFLRRTHLKQCVRAAARVSERLSVLGARCAVHVERVRVRMRGARSSYLGEALGRPDVWSAAADAENGLTTEARDALGDATTEGAVVEVAPVAPRSAAALVGRDDTLNDLVAHAMQSFSDRRARMATLAGEIGQGKSRLLGALRGRLRREGVEVIDARRLSGAADRRGLTRAILHRVTGLRGDPEPEDVCAACRRLGVPDVWPAVATTLGLADRTTPEVAATLAAPGAVRHGVSRAIAAGLAEIGRLRATAFVVDDAGGAERAVVDGMVLTCLDERPIRAWGLVTTPPGFADGAPRWDERTDAPLRVELGPLARAACDALVRALLDPVDVVPRGVLDRVWEVTGGTPGHVVEVVAALRGAGLVRRHPGTGAHFVASGELDAVRDLLAGSDGLFTCLAASAVAGLPGDLERFAELVAVAGEPASREELAAILAQLPASDRLARLDAGAALRGLVDAGLLVGDGTAARFRHPLIRQALEGRAREASRRTFHGAALRALEGRAGVAPARLGRHAAGAGHPALAAHHHLAAADEERAAHRYVETAEQLTFALDLGEGLDSSARVEALVARADVFYREHRFADAVADLGRARALAESLRDTRSVAVTLLQEAIVRDWEWDFDTAARLTDRAAALVDALDADELRARCLMARGRDAFRRERFDAAVEILGRAVAAARACGDRETEVIALLMLGSSLNYTDALDACERRYDEVVAMCERSGDRFHLAAALINRMNLWTARMNVDAACADGERARRIARELGIVQLEVAASYNVAELLHLAGRSGDALEPAVAARALHLRHVEEPGSQATLLLARALCAVGRAREAAPLLSWIREHCRGDTLPPSQAALRDMTELAAAGGEGAAWDEDAWSRLCERAETALEAKLDEHLELLIAAATHAVRAGAFKFASRCVERASDLAVERPAWSERIARARGVLRRRASSR